MIYPASTLLLASLVFNAASVYGAPIRISPASQPIARAVNSDPVLVERMKIIPVPPSQRSVDPDLEARSIHQSREIAPEIATRDTAPSNEVETRNPLPVIEEIVRRYPRQALYERHVARSPPSSPPEARSPSPEPEPLPPVERRFFRRALFERHQPRAEPPPPEAREAPPQEEVTVRHFPRKILAEYYVEKRSPSTPSTPEPPVAREPEPEPQPEPESNLPMDRMVRRYARRGMAERVEARQDNSTPPPVPSPPVNAPPVSSDAPVASAGPTPTTTTASSSASATPSSVPSSSSGNPVVDIINGANKAANFVGSPLPSNGLPVEIDREHETTVYHKKTSEHISQCGSPAVVNPNTPITPGGTPVVPGAPPVVSGSSTSVPSSVPSGATVAPPVVPQQGGSNPVPPAEPSKTTTDGTTSIAPPAPSDSALAPQVQPSTVPVATGDTGTPVVPPTRRDGELADPIILRGRSLGYSGPAWASYLKRSTN